MSSRRLVLNTVGIKSPLDVGDVGERAAERAHPSQRSSAEPAQQRPRSPRRRAAPRRAPSRAQATTVATSAFYGSGRPLQTSIALNSACAARLDELARAAGVSVNALAVAALHAGLPAATDDARAAIVDERVNRAGERAARIERNLRLPEHLRARLDELTAAARGRLPRATRADLINAALARGLPADAEQAAHLAAEHAQRLERAAAGS
jgi:hypothetical protein